MGTGEECPPCVGGGDAAVRPDPPTASALRLAASSATVVTLTQAIRLRRRRRASGKSPWMPVSGGSSGGSGRTIGIASSNSVGTELL